MNVRQESFVLEVTHRCNHDCLHCYGPWKNPVTYPRGEARTDQTLAILERMIEATGARLVSLSGGEPLLRPDLPRIVDFLVHRNVGVNLLTNGALLGDDLIERLGPRRIDVFEIPLLSSEREVHDTLTGVPGAFDRTVDAIASLVLAGATVIGTFVATRLNLPSWPGTARLAAALGLSGLMFNRFNPGGAGRDRVDILQPTPEALQKALDEAEAASRHFGIPVSCSVPIHPCLVDTRRYERLTFGFCAAGTEHAYYTVDPVGNVRPCNHTHLILGNVLTTPFEEMVGSEALTAFVRARPEFCKGCSLERACLGGCKAAAQVCFGCASSMDPFLAAFHARAVRPT